MSSGLKGPFESPPGSAAKTEPPPAYSRERPSARADMLLDPIRPLSLSGNAGLETLTTSTEDECIAHLKLLAAFADLRDTIGKSDSLFGIDNKEIERFSDPNTMNEAAAVLSEKRWAVYVTRAVERFTVWWQKCVPLCGVDGLNSNLTVKNIEHGRNLEKAPYCKLRIDWTPETMPPLDVIMVWHAYMLNPRSFLEDCIRSSRMSLWSTGLPWKALDECINSSTFDYVPGKGAESYFENLTGLEWDNLHMSPMKIVSCPKCTRKAHVPWTEGPFGDTPASAFKKCTGYADKNFAAPCPSCGFSITHEKLRVEKFRWDLHNLLKSDTPMPGTILSLRGAAENPNTERHPVLFPNKLIKFGIRQNLLRITDPTRSPNSTISTIRKEIETSLKSKTLIRQVNNSFRRSTLFYGEKISIRRMMSRYWDNSSIFALDLVGAVTRQGTFVVKMDEINWLQSPNLESTMSRLLRKYSIFWRIMIENPNRVAVPTLDVDLAWHTHQLTPRRYYAYSTSNATGKFIDHDDKIDESKLSDAFEWTSKQYQKLTNGQLYSECTCWYCEAIREFHNSGFFTSSSTSTARANAQRLHDENGPSSATTDPNPHISSHNAVRPKGRLQITAEVKASRLRAHYERALRRHQKRHGVGGGRQRGISKGGNSKEDEERENDRTRNAYTYAWGYPCLVMPMYAPYMGDPTVHETAYPCNPSCMNMGKGAVGNCVAGACGGEVAAGGCVSGAVSCGAGGSGGCGGGGGGGGCGGGGGGGGGGGSC